MIIIKRPIITEKSMKLAQSNFYTFEVDKKATKIQIAKKIAEKFAVKVISVKTINVKGYSKSQKKVRKVYKSAGFKKAMVQVAKGQKIAMFETPKEEADSSKGVTVTTAEGAQILREKKDILGRTKVRVERSAVGSAPTTQRKVITGK